MTHTYSNSVHASWHQTKLRLAEENPQTVGTEVPKKQENMYQNLFMFPHCNSENSNLAFLHLLHGDMQNRDFFSPSLGGKGTRHD